LVKVSVNRFILHRVEKMRREVEVTTDKLRDRMIVNLQEIFDAASEIARGEVKHQRIGRRMVKVTLKEKRRWLLVAACAAQTIKKIASNLDEKEIHAQLNKLEKLTKEATNVEKAKKTPKC